MGIEMPLIKLYSLLIRTLSKPVAKSIKERCTKSPALAARCVVIGQATHRWWSILSIRAAGQGVSWSRMRIKSLDEAEALNRGTDIIAESFVFSVAGACIAAEVTRTNYMKSLEAEEKAQKQAAKDQQWADLVADLDERLAAMERAQAETTAAMEALKKDVKQQRSWYGGGGGGGGGASEAVGGDSSGSGGAGKSKGGATTSNSGGNNGSGNSSRWWSFLG